MLESEHQEIIVRIVREDFKADLDIFSINNDEKCTLWMGKKKKDMGKLKGACDLLIAVPNDFYNGFFLEMKRYLPDSSKQRLSLVSPEQKKFLKRRRMVGYAADVAFGAKEAYLMINDYFNDIYKERYEL